MIINIVKILVSVIIVFIQVFFIDNFEFKFGLIFLPLIYFLFKADLNSIFNYGFIVFFFYDFFKNNFVGISLIIFLGLNLLINQISKIWGKEIVGYFKFICIFLLFYIFNYGLFSPAFLNNLFICLIAITFMEVRRSGYFRFN